MSSTTPSASPPVLVAVVSWNTRDLLDACLASLRPEADAGRARVIVVDNASSDGSAALAAERHPWAELVALEENVGFGRAVNLAAARAPAAAFVAPANADVALEPGALEALLAAARADPGAGVLAPRLVLDDGSTQHSLYPFPTLPFTLAFNLGVPRLSRRLADRWCLEGAWDPGRPRRAPWAIGAFLLVRRAAWDAVGGFDERQWMYAEDLDLGWRLRRAGWATRYVPGARVRHSGGAATSQAFGDRRAAQWQRATYAWMLRRRGAARTRAVALVNVAGAAARGALARDPHRRASFRAWARLHREGLRPAADLERHA
ncbi:MAG TPA: glycosyltransferase [Solirubrobacteraceae bacterium]|nr:glycosyltransferase [Solirubrobacteraceae bacterium]